MIVAPFSLKRRSSRWFRLPALCEFRHNLHLATTNRQPILIKPNPFVGKDQTLNGLFDLVPQFVDEVHVALPAFSTQPS